MANNQSVRRHLDAFTRGRIIGKLTEGRSVTRTAIRGSVVVVHEEPHPQMTGTLSYRPEETGGRQRKKSLDTRHRRDWTTDIAFYRGQKTARWWSVSRRPVRLCTFNACPSEKAFSVVPRTPELRDNEWGRVLFTDESRFSLSSDSHRILIWRERGSRNHPSKGTEALWVCSFFFMDDNAPCHRTVVAEQLLKSEDIERMDCRNDLGSQSHRACMGFSGQTLGSSYLTTSNDSGASIGAARRMGSNASTTH
ncbi:hypothetical protein TNCV_1290751 [Trichonephila clavipes]|nr:hypothetical protein TNCV_1290751 [Trichonephila clavipes]